MLEYLKKLYVAFYKTNDISEKAYIWSVFSNIVDIYPNNKEILKMFGEIAFSCKNLKLNIKRNDRIYNGEKRMFFEREIGFFEEIIPSKLANYYNLHDNKKYSKDSLNSILKTFLYGISNDLLGFYQEMKSNNTIIDSNKRKSDGYTGFLSLDENNSYICINKLETLKDLRILVHELGHAYYNYLNGITFKDSRDLNNLIKSEIPANWLELLFVIYLGNYLVEYRKNQGINSFDKLMYAFGKYYALRMKIDSEDKKLEDIYNNIYETDYHLLLNKKYQSR